MKRACLALMVLLATAGFLCLAAETGRKRATDAAKDAGLVIGEPITSGNLTIFPVMSKVAKRDDRFITLDEGLQAGTVEILEVSAALGASEPTPSANQPGPALSDPPFFSRAPFDPPAQQEEAAEPSTEPTRVAPPVPSRRAEDPFAEAEGPEQLVAEPNATPDQSDPFADSEADSPNQAQISLAPSRFGNDVNQLMVVNRSEKPLYLMPGEVIVGGDQDRTIGEELVIAPGKEPTPISVFCVEHGRWGSRPAVEYAGLVRQSHSLAMAVTPRVVISEEENETLSTELAKEANSGKFIGSIGSLNKGARLAVQKGEGQSAVWDEVGKQNAAARVQSQSGAFTANYASEDVNGKLEKYLSTLEEPVANSRNVVGVIVGVNGKVESMDVFESTPLFTKLWPKLLKSYALDAMSSAGATTKAKVCSRADAHRFLNDVADAKAKKTREEQGSLATVEAETDRVLLFTAHDRRVSRSAQPGAAEPAPSAAIDARDSLGLGGGAATGYFGGVHSSAFSK